MFLHNKQKIIDVLSFFQKTSSSDDSPGNDKPTELLLSCRYLYMMSDSIES